MCPGEFDILAFSTLKKPGSVSDEKSVAILILSVTRRKQRKKTFSVDLAPWLAINNFWRSLDYYGAFALRVCPRHGSGSCPRGDGPLMSNIDALIQSVRSIIRSVRSDKL